MLASTLFYAGLSLGFAGLFLVIKPIRRLRVPTRRRALRVAATGVAVAAVALALPAPESRVDRATTRLDEFAPVWQFHERHTIRIATPPSRVYDAIKRVRADEITLFGTLTWIRRGGQPLPEGILNAGSRAPLIDVATENGFVRLVDDPPRELVIGTVVVTPPGTRGTLTPELFQTTLPPGFALATMNFLVTPDGANGSIVSTETRVYASSASARRRFAPYWRVIYPGSAIIRRMWLGAIARRAMRAEQSGLPRASPFLAPSDAQSEPLERLGGRGAGLLVGMAPRSRRHGIARIRAVGDHVRPDPS